MSVEILVGDCRDVLRRLPDNHYQTVATSPPYWGLRDYGIKSVVWAGDPTCAHVWRDANYRPAGHTDNGIDTSGLEGGKTTQAQTQRGEIKQAFCVECGAWLGCLGLEPDPDMYVSHLVEIFREVRRVLRDDGTVWLNIGDCYAANRGYQVPDNKWCDVGNNHGMRASDFGLKPKDLVGIPWMVALALRADGWWLRSDVIWHKPNGMPESVRDRPTSAHEHVFLLSKSQRYFYDQDAIREPNSQSSTDRQIYRENVKKNGKWLDGIDERNDSEFTAASVGPINPAGRNKRDVWTIPTHPFPDSHFATFPPDLVEICLKAGASVYGFCPTCGAPWERVTESERTFESGSGKVGNRPNGKYKDREGTGLIGKDLRMGPTVATTTIGFRPACDHDAAPVACRVLDPFAGAGTTGLVADRLGLDATLIEIKAEYAEMARARIAEDAPPMFAEIASLPIEALEEMLAEDEPEQLELSL